MKLLFAVLLLLSGCGFMSSPSVEPARESDITGTITELNIQHGSMEVEVNEAPNKLNTDKVWLSEHVDTAYYNEEDEEIRLERLRAGTNIEVWLIEEETSLSAAPQGSIDTLIVKE